MDNFFQILNYHITSTISNELFDNSVNKNNKINIYTLGINKN